MAVKDDSFPERVRLPHSFPRWVPENAVFFVTVNCRERRLNQLCKPSPADLIRESIAFRKDRGEWWPHLVLLMPDHLHGLLSFPRDSCMRDTVFRWKEYAAKKLRICWQRDFFDHRLRDCENFESKALYIRMNPVRAGLCQKPEDWAFVWDAFTIGAAFPARGPIDH